MNEKSPTEGTDEVVEPKQQKAWVPKILILRWLTRFLFFLGLYFLVTFTSNFLMEQLRACKGKEFHFKGRLVQIQDFELNWNLLKLSRVRYEDSVQKIKLNQIQIDVDWFSWQNHQRFLRLQADTLNWLSLPGSKKTIPKMDTVFTPPKIHLPKILWSFELNILKTKWSQGELKFELDSLQISNPTSSNLNLKVKSTLPKDIPYGARKKISLQLDLDWCNSDSLSHHLWIRTPGAELQLEGKNQLSEILTWQTSLDLKVYDLVEFMALKNLPVKLHHLVCHTDLKYSLKNKSVTSRGDLAINTGAWNHDGLLPAFKWNMSYDLSWQKHKANIRSKIQGVGQDKQLIDLTLQSDFNGVDLTASSNHWKWKIGNFHLPLQIKQLQVHYENAQLKGHLLTPEGSLLYASGSLKPLNLRLKGGISNQEPWVYTWTGPQLKLKAAQVDVVFQKSWEMLGNVKAKVEDAWGTSADSVAVKLRLDQHHIEFPHIQIFFADQKPEFDGNIHWGGHHTELWFKTLDTNHFAKFQLEVPGNMEVIAMEYPLQQIPFPFVKNLPDLSAVVNGHMEMPNLKDLRSALNIRAKIPFGGSYYPLDVNLNVSEDHEKFILDDIRIRSKNNVLHSYFAFAKDAKLSLLERISEFRIDSMMVDLSQLPKLTPYSTQGELYGQLKYLYNPQMKSPLLDTKIYLFDFNVFDSLQKLVMKLPSAIIETDTSRNLSFKTRFAIGGQNPMEGRLETVISPLFPELNNQEQFADYMDLNKWLKIPRVFRSELTTDQGGVASLNLKSAFQYLLDENGLPTNKQIQRLTGVAKVSGVWPLPVKNAAITESNVNARIDWNLSGGVDSIYAKILQNQLTLNYPNLPIMKINAKGQLKNSLISLDLGLWDSLQNTFNLDVDYNLKRSKLEKFEGRSNRFVYSPNVDLKVVLSGLKIEHQYEQNDDHFKLNFDSCLLQKYDPFLGFLRAKWSGQLNYLIPVQNTLNHEFSGKINIQKSILENSTKVDYLKLILSGGNSLFNKLVLDKLSNKLQTPPKILTSMKKPILLNLQIQDEESDSLLIQTKQLAFPFSVNLKVLGSAVEPKLTGSIANSDQGMISLKSDNDRMQLSEISLNWNQSAIDQGVLNFNANKELRLCFLDSTQITGSRSDSVCQVNLGINGPLTSTRMTTEALCANNEPYEPRMILFGLAQGCLAFSSKGGLVELGGAIIDQQLSDFASKYTSTYTPVQRIQLNRLGNTDSTEVKLDFKIPWLKNDRWHFNGGYVNNDRSNSNTNAATENTTGELGANTYTYSYLGLDWTIWEKTQKGRSDKFFWDLTGVSKSTTSQDNNLESVSSLSLRTGLTWQRLFWNFCIFGYGLCEKADLP